MAGGGIGFRVNEHLRLTFTADREERESERPRARDYTRRRVLRIRQLYALRTYVCAFPRF